MYLTICQKVKNISVLALKKWVQDQGFLPHLKALQRIRTSLLRYKVNKLFSIILTYLFACMPSNES